MPAVDTFAALSAIMISTAVAALMFKYHREIAEALHELRNNWPRGGPGSPLHPSTARDTALLTRKRRKSTAL